MLTRLKLGFTAAIMLAVMAVVVSGCTGPQQMDGPLQVTVHPIERGQLSLVQTKFEHRSGVGAVKFSPDGKWALSAGVPKDQESAQSSEVTLILWRLDGLGGMEEAKVVGDRMLAILSIAISPNGQWALIGGIDREGTSSLSLWRLDGRGGLTRRRVVHNSPEIVTSAAAFSPDGKWVITAGAKIAGATERDTGTDFREGGTVSLWRFSGSGEMRLEKVLATGGELAIGIAMSPSGQWALTSALNIGGAGGRLTLWELDGKGEISRKKDVREGVIPLLAFSPVDSRVLTGNLGDDTLVSWKIDGQGTMAVSNSVSCGLPGPIASLAIAPDGKWALVGGPSWGFGDGTTLVMMKLDGEEGAPIQRFTGEICRDNVTTSAISPDGCWALTGGWVEHRGVGVLRLWRIE